ncbi:MAG: CooT family nickel-binding protein [Oscillospiraceae bacterium]|jgi:predicted RNA-binding protein
MCLSKVYVKNGDSEKMLLSNVQRISFDGDFLVFTDLFEHETRLQGKMIFADLVDGKVLVDTQD